MTSLIGQALIVTAEHNRYQHEKLGAKCNVLTKLTPEEEEMIEFKASVLTKIFVRHPEKPSEYFERQLSDMFKIDDYWLFSWFDKKHEMLRK